MSTPRPAPLASSPERRKHARKDVIGSQLLSVDVNSRQASALILDVSESGMALQLLVPLKSRSNGTFAFLPPGGAARVHIAGVLVWSSRDRVGVRFTAVDQSVRSALSEWIASLPPEKTPLPASDAEESLALTGDSFAPGELLELDHPLPPVSPPITPVQESLDSMASRARILLCGTGAAVAWADAGGMVCRASNGNAPPPGVPVDITRGLSGECVRTGSVVRCDDTECDPRVDAEVCRQLNLRSAIIVPIVGDSGVMGLLEVFSNKPLAFSENDVPTLRTLATQFRPAEETRHPPLAVVRPPDPSRPPAPSSPPPRTNVAQSCTRKPSPQDVETVRVKLLSDAQSPESKRNLKLAIATVVVSGSVLVGSLYLSGDKVSGPSYSAPQKSSEPQAQAGTVELPFPAQSARGSAATSRPNRRAASTRHVSSPQTRTASDDASGSPSTPASVQQPSPAPVDVAESKLPAMPLAAEPGTAHTESQLLASLPSGTAPVPKLTPGQNESRATELKLVHQVAPKYPKTAMLEKRGGTVVLRVSVGSNGRVKDARLISGDEEFVKAALDAVRQWRYEPYKLDGKPIEVTTEAIITFSMTAKSGQ